MFRSENTDPRTREHIFKFCFDLVSVRGEAKEGLPCFAKFRNPWNLYRYKWGPSEQYSKNRSANGLLEGLDRRRVSLFWSGSVVIPWKENQRLTRKGCSRVLRISTSLSTLPKASRCRHCALFMYFIAYRRLVPLFSTMHTCTKYISRSLGCQSILRNVQKLRKWSS